MKICVILKPLAQRLLSKTVLDCSTLLKMAVPNLMFLVFLCHELVLNGEVVFSLMFYFIFLHPFL